ncbi:MAG: hypothetical protein IT385_06640 [Deltaproteobacteria bacterium]|nr:hypothetical protein [Deltaproteobacteria bacterium]
MLARLVVLSLSMYGSLHVAQAAPPGGVVLDQAQTGTANAGFSVTMLGLKRQQEIVAGASGSLAGIELYVKTNDQSGQSFMLHLRRGAAWQETASIFSSEVFPPLGGPVGWIYIDMSTAAIELTAGETFVIEIDGTGAPGDLGLGGDHADPYPAGRLMQKYGALSPSLQPLDLAFRTYLAAPATPPTADAGPAQDAWRGAIVELDGTGSYADDTDDLLFDWSFASVPTGSVVTLQGAHTATPWFEVDQLGTYVVELIVIDPTTGLASDPATVVISSENLPPVAVVGPGTTVFVGQSATLDGSASDDPEGDPLTFAWLLTTRPEGSAAVVSGTGAVVTLVPDVPGTYTVKLDVFDGHDLAAVETTVLALSPDEVTVAAIGAALQGVETLGRGQVTNGGNQMALANWLRQAAQAAEDGDAETAGSKLAQVMNRADGCVLRGAVDGKGPAFDWVVDCDAQAALHDALVEALAALDWLD